MAGVVDVVVSFVVNNPIAVAFGVILLGFILGGYFLLRRSITEFRRGFEGE